MENVSISRGNIKMGAIQSVSLPAMVTCSKDAVKHCGKKCYAVRMEKRRATVKDTYTKNFKILTENPEQYWREVEASVMTTTVFRWHVSGDIVNEDYLQHMVDIATRNNHCNMVCFTKKYDIVNAWIEKGGVIPQNLHLIFSVWRDLECPNPHGMPECHIIYKDGYTTARDGGNWLCSGNCFECYKCRRNCFHIKNGEQILIKEH